MSTLNDMKYKTIVAKRKNPYEGNNEFGDKFEGELSSQQFAKGGMVKCASCGGKMAEGGMSCAQGCKMAEGGPVDKKKNAVMAIIAKIGKKPMGSPGRGVEEMESEGEGEGMEGGDMMGEAKMSAASEVMDALKGGDVAAFSSALENFVKACGGYED